MECGFLDNSLHLLLRSCSVIIASRSKLQVKNLSEIILKAIHLDKRLSINRDYESCVPSRLFSIALSESSKELKEYLVSSGWCYSAANLEFLFRGLSSYHSGLCVQQSLLY